MSQGSTVLPTVGPITGLAEQGLINAALAALLSNNSGGSAPASPTPFQFWADTSVSNTVTVRQYINGTWMPLWVIDTNLLQSTLTPYGAANWAAAAGTHDAITASYDPPVTVLVDGMVLFFRATAANQTATPTFTPNSGVITAHTITKLGGQALWGADIPAANAECAVRYNAANTRWELIYPTFDVPVGGIVPYFGGTVPGGFALPQGQNLSSAQFPIASAVLGTTYGNPGGGNFTMPDLRGRFFFNLDSGGSGRITATGGNFDGTVLGNMGGAQNRTLSTGNIPQFSFTPSGTIAINSGTTIYGGTGTITANLTAGTAEGPWPNSAAAISAGFSGNSISIGSASPSALPTLPPSMGINCMMRIA